jgi:ferric-dicitrate binding protein FerR (iron transport regulator)
VNRTEREAAVRRLMERSPPRMPPGLAAQAVRRGERVLRRRAVARRVLWLLLLAAAVAFTVWALTVQPWATPPSETTPPLTDW